MTGHIVTGRQDEYPAQPQGAVVEHRVAAANWRQAAEAARAEGYLLFDWLAAAEPVPSAGADAGALEVTVQLLKPTRIDDRGVVLTPLAVRRISATVPAGAVLPSLTPFYRGAAWHEREAAEMLGLRIDGFDDGTGQGLRGLLLRSDLTGAPRELTPVGSLAPEVPSTSGSTSGWTLGSTSGSTSGSASAGQETGETSSLAAVPRHPLRKNHYLRARVSTPWPGTFEPGAAREQERDEARRASGRPARSTGGRRRLLPPGVPDPDGRQTR